MGPEVGQVLPLRPGRQLHRIPQPPEGQPHRAVLIVLHAQKTAPQLVIRPQVQPLPAEGVVIGISGAEDVVIKVMGRAVLLINLPVLRKEQTEHGAVRLLHGDVQLPGQFVGKPGQGVPLLPHPGQMEGCQPSAVHQHPAAPLTDAVVKPQGPQAAAVHQGVIPHPLQGPGQGQVLQVPVAPGPRVRPGAAGHQQVLPLRGSGGGREGVVPQGRHRQAV